MEQRCGGLVGRANKSCSLFFQFWGRMGFMFSDVEFRFWGKKKKGRKSPRTPRRMPRPPRRLLIFYPPKAFQFIVTRLGLLPPSS
ncbi:hypothetical protein RchiOBHm_Chr4g0412391 [Rosa chinensis]|uniref:Uncharacterized protein n=1 Tax=Rosa chinensis TaxID=74649 RepID=A0A2P6QVW4_ROSCH|nr:hypothetical protein RchiOBHm_Chr4g0412391 [Rosa chinensis]